MQTRTESLIASISFLDTLSLREVYRTVRADTVRILGYEMDAKKFDTEVVETVQAVTSNPMPIDYVAVALAIKENARHQVYLEEAQYDEENSRYV